jgi:D-inositol-3-phosphate glycosyltransferase
MLSLHTSPLAQPGTGDSGGMNVVVRELGAALAQAGVHTRIYTRRTDPSARRRQSVEPGLEVVHVDAGPPDLPKELLPSVIDEFADRVDADLDSWGEVSAIHANYWLSGVAGHRLKHGRGIPLVSTFHTLARVKSSTGDDEPDHRAAAEAAVIGCSDAITASNPTEADDLVTHYGAPADRIELVAPGVHHAFFSPGEQRGARAALGLGDGPVLLFVGRIQPLKGLELAVGALDLLSRADATLVVIGGPSGPEGLIELQRIEEQVAALGLRGRVRFVPPQQHHVLSTYYRAADVVVVPSRSESFGLVALEAMACGVPVVAAAVGGLLTLVEDGRTGFLVEDRDPASFAKCIDQLLVDPALRADMGRAAATVAAGYTWSAAAGRLRRVCADLASSRRLVECA